MVNKRVRNAVLGCNLKNNRMISVRLQGKPFNITVIQVYAPTSNAEEAEQIYEDLQNLLELKPQKVIVVIRNVLPWKQMEIILLFLSRHPSTAFQTLLLTMMATPFRLRDSCP